MNELLRSASIYHVGFNFRPAYHLPDIPRGLWVLSGVSLQSDKDVNSNMIRKTIHRPDIPTTVLSFKSPGLTSDFISRVHNNKSTYFIVGIITMAAMGRHHLRTHIFYPWFPAT